MGGRRGSPHSALERLPPAHARQEVVLLGVGAGEAKGSTWHPHCHARRAPAPSALGLPPPEKEAEGDAESEFRAMESELLGLCPNRGLPRGSAWVSVGIAGRDLRLITEKQERVCFLSAVTGLVPRSSSCHTPALQAVSPIKQGTITFTHAHKKTLKPSIFKSKNKEKGGRGLLHVRRDSGF